MAARYFHLIISNNGFYECGASVKVKCKGHMINMKNRNKIGNKPAQTLLNRTVLKKTRCFEVTFRLWTQTLKNGHFIPIAGLYQLRQTESKVKLYRIINKIADEYRALSLISRTHIKATYSLTRKERTRPFTK